MEYPDICHEESFIVTLKKKTMGKEYNRKEESPLARNHKGTGVAVI